MQRRSFLHKTGLAALATTPVLAAAARASDQQRIRWKMVTAWPKNFPGPGSGANRLAALIGEMSGGRLDIKVYGAGELVPAYEVFDAVSAGTAEMGHAASHYWAGKLPAASFFGGVPFGMTANEMNAWFYHGGGLELWHEVYAPYGLIPMPAGNAGMQMAGWFRKPINTVADFRGLKMRISGLGGEVLRRLGAVTVSMPPGEVFTALQTGALDAAEFVGPYSDLPLGLYRIAKYYYTPGWADPGSPLECTINRRAYERLPGDLQKIVMTACKAMNDDLFAEFTANNALALAALTREHGVSLSVLPDSVIAVLREQSVRVVDEVTRKDKTAQRVYAAYRSFAERVFGWTGVSEFAYLQSRGTAHGAGVNTGA